MHKNEDNNLMQYCRDKSSCLNIYLIAMQQWVFLLSWYMLLLNKNLYFYIRMDGMRLSHGNCACYPCLATLAEHATALVKSAWAIGDREHGKKWWIFKPWILKSLEKDEAGGQWWKHGESKEKLHTIPLANLNLMDYLLAVNEYRHQLQ